MVRWPVAYSGRTRLPCKGEPGGFLESRGDRKHCGVDIYAPKGSNVFAVESGSVEVVDVFTSKEMIPYWNTTYQIILRGDSGLFYRFAELKDTVVKKGESVVGGQVIGHVGEVLNKECIDETSPLYIQQLKKQNHCSMLHLEIYKSKPVESTLYLGGNWFGKKKPKDILNPTEILNNICPD